MTDVWINDRPIEEYGFGVVSLDSWWDAVGQQFPTSVIPGRQGSRATDRGAISAERRIPLVTTVSASTVADRLAKLDAMAQGLKGTIEIRVADDPERVGYGTLEKGSVTFFQPQLALPKVQPTYELVMANPLKYDRRRQLLVAPAASTAKAVPCGSAPHRGRLWVMDTLGSRSVDIVAADGTIVDQMRLTGTLAANEWLEIEMDADAPTITHVSGDGAIRTDAFSWLHPFDAFPTFDPQDRPGLRHAGGGDLVLSYRRAYVV